MEIKEIYNNNADFRDYVDKYCRTYRISLDDALEHKIMRDVAKQYTNPNNEYTFGNVGPLSRLTNGDRIRSMSDEEMSEDMVERMNRYRSHYKGWVGDFDGVCGTREQAVSAEMEWLKQNV